MTGLLETTENQGAVAPVEDAQIAEATPEDNMQAPVYNKIQMQDVVKREKQKAFERGKREAMMELQAQQQQPEVAQQQEQPTQQQPQQQGGGSFGGMQQYSQADIERIIKEQAPRMLNEHVQQLKNEHTVNSFVNKMQQAESKYPGIQEKLNDLDYSTIAPMIQMANDQPNTADIMQELLDNPMKMGNLMMLMHSQPRLAQKAMQDLSGSIKTNEDAKSQAAQANDPLSKLRPSTSAGLADESTVSVNDLRKLLSKGQRIR